MLGKAWVKIGSRYSLVCDAAGMEQGKDRVEIPFGL